MFVSGPMFINFMIIIMFVSGPIVSRPMFIEFMVMFVSGPIVSGPIHSKSFLVATTSHAHWSPASDLKTKCGIHTKSFINSFIKSLESLKGAGIQAHWSPASDVKTKCGLKTFMCNFKFCILNLVLEFDVPLRQASSPHALAQPPVPAIGRQGPAVKLPRPMNWQRAKRVQAQQTHPRHPAGHARTGATNNTGIQAG